MGIQPTIGDFDERHPTDGHCLFIHYHIAGADRNDKLLPVPEINRHDEGLSQPDVVDGVIHAPASLHLAALEEAKKQKRAQGPQKAFVASPARLAVW